MFPSDEDFFLNLEKGVVEGSAINYLSLRAMGRKVQNFVGETNGASLSDGRLKGEFIWNLCEQFAYRLSCSCVQTATKDFGDQVISVH